MLLDKIFQPTNRRRRFLLWVLAFITMGAMISVNAGIDSLTCLNGILCDPNPILGVGNLTLKPANVSELGGVFAGNCTTNYFAMGILDNGSLNCALPPNGTGGNSSNGTVTSILRGYGFNLTGKAITTTGTLDVNDSIVQN